MERKGLTIEQVDELLAKATEPEEREELEMVRRLVELGFTIVPHVKE
jgi:hypothetical protein